MSTSKQITTVYILLEFLFDDCKVLAVYANREPAEKRRDEMNKKIDFSTYHVIEKKVRGVKRAKNKEIERLKKAAKKYETRSNCSDPGCFICCGSSEENT